MPKENDLKQKHKIAMYLTTEQLLNLVKIKAKRMFAGASLSGVERTRLIREGIDLLIQKEGIE